MPSVETNRKYGECVDSAVQATSSSLSSASGEELEASEGEEDVVCWRVEAWLGRMETWNSVVVRLGVRLGVSVFWRFLVGQSSKGCVG